jgi:Leucine-rich repeat (LRR) protein
MQHFLLELLHTNPFLSHLDFSRRQFTIIDPPSLQLLTRFTELRRIDLSENLIRHLPQDLSLLANIVEFDLNGNPLEDLEAAVDSLAQMPSLRRLRINLHEEE